MIESKYRAKLVQYGFLTGQIDPATNMEKPPQFYATFSFIDEAQANHSLTWFGGFKELQPGKKTSQREITLGTIDDLGYKGTNHAELAPGVSTGLLNTEKEFSIDVEYQKDNLGSVKVDANGNPKFSIKWVNDPEKTGFKNQMSVQDAAVKIGGLNLGNDLMAMRNKTGAAPTVNTGYNLPPQQNQMPPQQQYQAPPQQNNFQAPPQQNTQQHNQQMGFDQSGKPPF